MTYYSVIEVYINSLNEIRERIITKKDSRREAEKFLTLSQELKPNSKIYISIEDRKYIDESI